jgi:hypothetical protein
MTPRRWIVTMALMPFVAAPAVGLGAVWVTGDASVFGVVGIIAAMIGAGLLELALRTGHVAGGIPLKVRHSCP